jgi:photosystem II stability/assembly factor-like uncharacterized protein
MKKKLLTAIAITIAAHANAQWINQNVPLGFEGYIFDIETVDANTVWGTPYDNSTGTATPTASYVKTTDGGNTWTKGDIAGAATNDLVSNIWPLDSQTCYVAMYNSSAAGGGVYKTIDGGASWGLSGSNMFIQTTSFPDFVCFHDMQNGVAVGDPIGPTHIFEIYYTADSGNTWTEVLYPDAPYATTQTEYGVVNLFTTAQGHIWFGTSEGDVYHSKDMGHTWTKSATGFPAYTNTSGARYDISDIAFTDSLNGIVMQINAVSYLVKRTSDGGATWADFTPTGPFLISDIDAIPGTGIFISAGSSNAGGYGTSLSMDYGLTWTVLDSLASHTSVDFSDNMTGWSGEYIPAGGPGGAWKYTGDPLAIAVQLDKTQQTQVYPNPSHGIVNIMGIANSPKTLFEITDVEGKTVFNETFESLHVFNKAINLTGLAAGFYTLKITDGNNITQHKMVIEK